MVNFKPQNMKLFSYLTLTIVLLLSINYNGSSQTSISYFSDSTFIAGEVDELDFALKSYDYNSIIIDSMILVNLTSNKNDTIGFGVKFNDTTNFIFRGFIPENTSAGKYNIVLIDKNENYYVTDGIIKYEPLINMIFYSDTVIKAKGYVSIHCELESFDYENITLDSILLVNTYSGSPYNVVIQYSYSSNDTTNFEFKGVIEENDTNGCYDVFLLDANKNTYKTNGKIYIQLPSIIDNYICMVTVDAETQKNMIIWKTPDNFLTDSTFVYKEISSGSFKKIGSKYNGDGSNYFIDNTSNPAQNADRYIITFADSTENYKPEYYFSHKTIHLLMSLGVGGTINLMWEAYEGIYYYTNYNIYRGTSYDDLALLATLPSSNHTYTDLTPPTGDVYYVVSITIPDGCEINTTLKSAEELVSSTKSNFVKRGVNLINNPISDVNLTVRPNPAYDNLYISSEISNDEQLDIEILSMEGKTILKRNITNSSAIDISSIESGYYILIVNSSNERFTKQLIIQ